MAAVQLQRWALQLSAHQYKVQFHPTKAHANADVLSCLPLLKTNSKRQPETDIFSIRQIKALPITAAQLKCLTGCDPILSKVLRYTKQGWQGNTKTVLEQMSMQN